MITMDQLKLDAIKSEKAKAELSDLDLSSIRAIREYIVGQSDAPQLLKDKEAAASAARLKVK